MMSLALMMTASPNDVTSLMFLGKHYIIANEMSSIIFAKQIHHITESDALFNVVSSPLLCYNTPKAVII